MTSSVRLHGDHLSVEVRPGKGADITSVTERTSGIDVLWRTPWGRRDLAGAPVTGDSQTDWLARYGGGWQQLVPARERCASARPRPSCCPDTPAPPSPSKSSGSASVAPSPTSPAASPGAYYSKGRAHATGYPQGVLNALGLD